jgi:hypothetical protein
VLSIVLADDLASRVNAMRVGEYCARKINRRKGSATEKKAVLSSGVPIHPYDITKVVDPQRDGMGCGPRKIKRRECCGMSWPIRLQKQAEC